MKGKRTKWKARKRAAAAKAQKAAHVAALKAREERAALPIQPYDCLPAGLAAWLPEPKGGEVPADLGQRPRLPREYHPDEVDPFTGCRDSSREQLRAAYRAGAAIDRMREAADEAEQALHEVLEGS